LGGIPAITLACTGFGKQARIVGQDFGFYEFRVAEYPGHISTHSRETRLTNYRKVVLPQVLKLLMESTTEKKQSPGPAAKKLEPGPKDIVFRGSFEEVNQFFYENLWSDGLPIVPPTIKKVEEFLKYTDRFPEDGVGIYMPGNLEGTIWKVAVIGVMAGCRPEYMPVLIAIAEAMADPKYRIQDGGSTPGWEATIVLNGKKLIEQLGFNFREAVRRPGNQANTSIGRFYRLFSRNMARLLPGITDKATFGQMFRAVIPEDEETAAKLKWDTLSVQRGFKTGDPAVTLMSIRYEGAPLTTTGATAAEHLDRMAFWIKNIIDVGLWAGVPGVTGGSRSEFYKEFAVMILMSPTISSVLAKNGYSIDDVRKALWEKSKIPAREWDARMASYDASPKKKTACDLVKLKRLPPEFCQSQDPDRLLPVYYSPEQLMVVVTGDPARNRSLFMVNNQEQGFPVTRKIHLPANWDRLMEGKR